MLAAKLSYYPKWITHNALARHAKTSSFLKSRDHLSNHRDYGPYRSQAIREAINAPFRPEQLPGTDAEWMSELLSIHGCSHVGWMAEVNCWMHDLR
jgi:hypothetical protein